MQDYGTKTGTVTGIGFCKRSSYFECCKHKTKITGHDHGIQYIFVC